MRDDRERLLLHGRLDGDIAETDRAAQEHATESERLHREARASGPAARGDMGVR